ncbi:MAG: hypothetical protein IJJ55_06150 [Clostridia bacterium]|nr:hypothetical protein [Clostridia bacterium]
MADISKITLPSGSTYDLKDSGARQLIADIAAAGLTYVVVSELPAASSSTMGTIYLTPVATAGSNDNYDEWLTLRSGDEGSYTYSWEKIGNTSMDLSNYVADGDTISLGSITSGSNTTGISVSDHTVTQGSVEASGSFTPAGSNAASAVTISPTTDTVYSMTSAGSVTAGVAASYSQGTDTFNANTPTVIDTTKFSGGSFTRGSFSGGSFTQGTDSFTAPSYTVTSETLTIGAASFTQGSDSFTAATHAADSFTAASLANGFYTAGTAASFEQGEDSFTANTPTVVTLPSRSSAKTVWTGYNTGVSNTYAAAQTFTGTADTVSVSGSTSGVAVSAHSVTDSGHTHSVTVSGEVDKS